MRAWIGLGANLGDAATSIASAIDAIGAIDATRVVRASALYRSAPVDAEGPDFVNAVVEVDTALTPAELLRRLLAIENAAGRQRPHRNAPRTLDLDLLLATDARGPVRIDTPALTLPHPRMHGRAFVLVPLAELDPALAVPGRGPVAALLAACADQRIERIGPAPERDAPPAGARR